MTKIIDISVPIDKNLPAWPGNAEPVTKRIVSMNEGEEYNESLLEMNAHIGTHIDAPLHFVADGRSIDQMELGMFMGPAYVADLADAKEITANVLKRVAIPKTIKKVLFKSTNSLLWEARRSTFYKGYVGLTPDGALWLVDHKIELIGNDYLSVAKFEDAAEVHNILLKKNVVLLEGIKLTGVEEGVYNLLCFPVKIANAEAAPVRAVLIRR